MGTDFSQKSSQRPCSKTVTGIVVLAAGYSRRFGSVKLNAGLLNGNTVISQTISRIKAATNNFLVVTRPELQSLLLHAGATPESLVLCEDANMGMGHTLAFGMAQLPDWEGCLVCLGDMPFIATATYVQMLAALHHDTILLPQYEGETGNPVGFGCDFFPALRAVQGDTGGRDVVRANRERVRVLPVSDAAILQDIDTPEDLARLDGV